MIDVIVATKDYHILAAAINTFGKDDKFNALCEIYGKRAALTYLETISQPSEIPLEHRLALVQSLAACGQDHKTYLLASQEIARIKSQKSAKTKKPFVINGEQDLFAPAIQKINAREDN